ncbi:MAG: hypothetical protein SGJ02_00550 [bacterium]|nr:hypothetical protein [bacterium]
MIKKDNKSLGNLLCVFFEASFLQFCLLSFRKTSKLSKRHFKTNPYEIIALLDKENGSRLVSWIKQTKEQPFFALMYMYGSHFPYYASNLNDTLTSKEISSYYFPKEKLEFYRDRFVATVKDLDSLLAQFWAPSHIFKEKTK